MHNCALHNPTCPHLTTAIPIATSLKNREQALLLLFLYMSHYVKDRVSKYVLLRKRIQTLVEDIGFEPMTPCLQSRCSSQLS